jgi:hypothetical protein
MADEDAALVWDGQQFVPAEPDPQQLEKQARNAAATACFRRRVQHLFALYQSAAEIRAGPSLSRFNSAKTAVRYLNRLDLAPLVNTFRIRKLARRETAQLESCKSLRQHEDRHSLGNGHFSRDQSARIFSCRHCPSRFVIRRHLRAEVQTW